MSAGVLGRDDFGRRTVIQNLLAQRSVRWRPRNQYEQPNACDGTKGRLPLLLPAQSKKQCFKRRTNVSALSKSPAVFVAGELTLGLSLVLFVCALMAAIGDRAADVPRMGEAGHWRMSSIASRVESRSGRSSNPRSQIALASALEGLLWRRSQ